MDGSLDPLIVNRLCHDPDIYLGKEYNIFIDGGDVDKYMERLQPYHTVCKSSQKYCEYIHQNFMKVDMDHIAKCFNAFTNSAFTPLMIRSILQIGKNIVEFDDGSLYSICDCYQGFFTDDDSITDLIIKNMNMTETDISDETWEKICQMTYSILEHICKCWVCSSIYH